MGQAEDRALRDAVLAALDTTSGLDASAIGVAVKAAVVTLSGHVPSYAQRILAERAATAVRGIRGVAQDLEARLDDGAGREDDEVLVRVLQALDGAIPHVAAGVSARADDGHVILTGQVLSLGEKDRAEACVRDLPGVQRFTSHLTIRTAARAADLQRYLDAVFERQARADARRIAILTQDGRVRLEGAVPSERWRRLAVESLRAAPGVHAVEDHLKTDG